MDAEQPYTLTGENAAAGLGATHTAVKDGPRTDAEIAARVEEEIRFYPWYSVWDHVTVRVRNGDVELLGEVNQPFKKADLGRLAAEAPGVGRVRNALRVLPLSNADDRIRLQVARAVFGDAALLGSSPGMLPGIHIIVDNGQVTLEGTVATVMDKRVAGTRASSTGIGLGPVANHLRVEGPDSSRN